MTYLGYLRRFLTSHNCNKDCSESNSLCSLESFYLVRKETHRDDIKGTLFTYPPSVQPEWSLFRARSGNRLISGLLIPSLCARMTCKEWNPQEHLRPVPWQRITISARSASSRSFCARNHVESVSLGNEIELIPR